MRWYMQIFILHMWGLHAHTNTHFRRMQAGIANTYTHTQVHTCIDAEKRPAHTSRHSQSGGHSPRRFLQEFGKSGTPLMIVYVVMICLSVRMYVYACIHVLSVCMYVCTYIRTYVCVYMHRCFTYMLTCIDRVYMHTWMLRTNCARTFGLRQVHVWM